MYGDPDNDDEAWSISWNFDEFDEFLIASGNMEYWMRVTRNDLVGEDNLKEYENEQIRILSGSRKCYPTYGM